MNLSPFFWNFVNPKTGITYAVNKNTVLYTSLGMSGREPTRNDIFQGEDNLLSDASGNPILGITTPEYVTDYELGTRFRFQSLSIDVNAFYMKFKDEIVLNGQFGPNGLALNNNVEKSIRSGIELDVSYQPWNWINLQTTASYNHSRIEKESEVFEPILTPKFIANQELQYKGKRFFMGLTLRYQGDSFIDFSNENSIQDFTRLNLMSGYKWNNCKLSVIVNNITNERYFTNGFVDINGVNKFFVQAPLNVYTILAFKF